jgi:photoactive yellow protein
VRSDWQRNGMSLTQRASDPLAFETISLHDLQWMTEAERDALPFGVVGLSRTGLVNVYNATEERLAGISAANIKGTHYFSGTAQCMNNYMVAQRFEDQAQLDVTIDYVLTLRMRPTPVRLRLLKHPLSALAYILILRHW